MKGKIVWLIILLPFFASAQNKETIDSLAKSKLKSLTDSWSLGISDSADMDIEVYNKFKMLFDSSATIEDDLNVLYGYTGFKKPGNYKASGKYQPFDIYAHDVALAVLIRSITFDESSILTVDFNVNNPATRIFRLKRVVDFQKTGRYVLPDTYADAVFKSRRLEPKNDSLQRDLLLNAEIQKNEDSVYKFTSDEVLTVRMVFDRALNDMIITGITTVSNDIRCTNDDDGDGIIDNRDSLPETAGDFTANGKPDYDLDGIADIDDKCPTTFGVSINKGCPIEYFYTKTAFDIFAGGQFNSVKINLPGTYQLGYVDASGANAVDTSLSKKGSLKSPGLSIGFQAGGNLIYYFGKKERKSGILIGINYARFTGNEYKLTDPMIYTFKSFDGVNPYRRQITVSSLTEKIKFKLLNLPVLFNYRWHLKNQINTVIKLQAGPSLMIFSGTSDYNAVVNFEGIYQIDPIGKNQIVYYNPFDPSSIYNIYLTANSINTQNPNQGANGIFQQLNSAGYDFANGKNYKGTQNLGNRMAVAFNAGLDLQQKVSEGLTMKAGINFVYGSLLERKEKYKTIDKTTDVFQSVYYSTARSGYNTYGINIGIVYNL